jgi:NADPH-dependent curcumin reductase CurA
VALPAPGPGQLLVANEYLSVDPYMRGRMSDKKSYIEPYDVDAPMDGAAVGRVLASNAEGFAPGDHVVHLLGWRDHAVIDAATAQKADPNLAPLSAYLGVLGATGLTAYIGLTGSQRSRTATPSSSPARPARSAARSARSQSSRAPAG